MAGDSTPQHEKRLEIVFVSSDKTADECTVFMHEMHGEWLRVAYDSPLRAQLKAAYGVFAPDEAAEFKGVKRRSGLPTLILVGANMQEHALLECASGGGGVKLLNSKGAAVADVWARHAWPAPSVLQVRAAVLPAGLRSQLAV